MTNGRPEWKDQPAKKVFVSQLTTHLNKLDLAWPKTETLAEECGISRGYVGTLSKELEAEGKLIRRKFTRGEVLPHPDPKKRYPAPPGLYLYYVTPMMFDEAPNPGGVPIAILKPFCGGDACALSKHHSKTKSCSPSKHHSGSQTCSPSETGHVNSVSKSCIPSERPLQEPIKNNKKEQFDANRSDAAEIKKRVDELARKFEKNEPFEPGDFKSTVNDAIQNGVSLPKIVEQKNNALSVRHWIARDDYGIIRSMELKDIASIESLLNERDVITGNPKSPEMVVSNLAQEMSIDGAFGKNSK